MPNIYDKPPSKQAKPTRPSFPIEPAPGERITVSAPLMLVGEIDSEEALWQGNLRYSKNGITREVGNAVLILTNHHEWQGLRFDEFTGKETADGLPTLRGLPEPSSPEALEVYAIHWLSVRYGQAFSTESARTAIHVAARERKVHRVRDYLDTLVWDGKPRISKWLHTYLGGDDTTTNEAIGRMWLISAVARAYQPGAKADHMLVLEGDQGARKTTALEALCSPAWFQPELGDLRNKDSQLTLRGKWIVCMDELHALRSADVTELAKNYLTRTVDKYRPPYGRHEVEQPRSCVFAGTTNADTYLTDPTGNRRFWPVRVAKCHPVDLEAIKSDRDQLWAEAKEAYLGKEQWWPSQEMQVQLTELTEERTEGDEWDGRVASYCAGYDEYVTIGGFLSHIGLEPVDWDKKQQMRVGRILARLGWVKRQVRKGGVREYRYERKQTFALEPPDAST